MTPRGQDNINTRELAAAARKAAKAAKAQRGAEVEQSNREREAAQDERG
jgi:multimeric flavodoxin WrbA